MSTTVGQMKTLQNSFSFEYLKLFFFVELINNVIIIVNKNIVWLEFYLKDVCSLQAF